MGIFLMLALLGGIVVGGLVAAAPGIFAIVVVSKRSLRWVDGLVFLAATAVAIAVVALLPYGEVRPGNDYDVAARNLFLQGAGYTLAFGIGALGAAISAMRRPIRGRAG